MTSRLKVTLMMAPPFQRFNPWTGTCHLRSSCFRIPRALEVQARGLVFLFGLKIFPWVEVTARDWGVRYRFSASSLTCYVTLGWAVFPFWSSVSTSVRWGG